MRQPLRKILALSTTSALILTLMSANAAIAVMPAGPSDVAINYSPAPENNLSPGASVVWRSPNAADSVILGYRISARKLPSDIANRESGGLWNPIGTWTDILAPNSTVTAPFSKYALYSDSGAVIPTTNGYGLRAGDNMEWRVGAVSEEQITERKPGASNICVLRISGVVECSGKLSNSTAGGFNNTVSPYTEELNDGKDYDYRAVDGISPEGRVGLVSKLEMGYEMACVISRSAKLWCWGNQMGSNFVNVHRVHPWEESSFLSVPRQVDVGANVLDVAIARETVCALLATGKIKCWGSNQYGLLGGGPALPTTTIGRNVSAIVDRDNWVFSDITANDWTMCATATSKGGVAVNKQLVCWGKTSTMPLVSPPNKLTVAEPYAFNDNSLTGNRPAGTTANGNFGILSISLSESHGCWVKENVGLQCWSRFNVPGSFTNTLLNGPTTIDSTVRTATELTSDLFGSCWIKAGAPNQLKCFGDKYNGIAGANQQALTPVNVQFTNFPNSAQINPTKVSAFRGKRCFVAAPIGNKLNVGGCWGFNENSLIVLGTELNVPDPADIFLPSQDPNLRRPNFTTIQSKVIPPINWNATIDISQPAEGQVGARFSFPYGTRIGEINGIGYEYSADNGRTWSARAEIPRDNFILSRSDLVFSILIDRGLPNGEALKFKFYAKTAAGFGVASQPTGLVNMYRTAGAVRNITFTPVTKFTGRLTWDKPLTNTLTDQALTITGRQTLYYIVVRDVATGAFKFNKGVSGESALIQKDPPQITTESDGLVPGREYSVQITVSSISPAGQSANAQFSFIMSAIPEAPVVLSVARVNSTSVNISWRAPIDSGLPLSYNIYLYRVIDGLTRNALPVATSSTNSYIFANTEPNAFYDVEVAAVNTLGGGPKSSAWRFSNNTSLIRDTNLPPIVSPSSPLNLRTDGEVDTMTAIDWDAPISDGGVSLDGELRLDYDFRYSVDNGLTKSALTRQNVSIQRDGTYAIISNIPFTSTNKAIIYISARNIAGSSPETSLEITRLVRPDMPTNVNVGVVQYWEEEQWKSFYRIEWSPPLSDGGSPITRYVIYDRTCLGGCDAPVNLAANNQFIEYPISEFTVGVPVLLYLHAVNAKGESNGKAITFIPAVSKPSSPVIAIDAQSGDSDSMVIRFSEPESPGAALDGYLLSYSPVGALTLDQVTSRKLEILNTGINRVLPWTPIDYDEIRFDNGDVGLVVSNLTLGSYYYFRVQAANTFGISDLNPFTSYAFAKVEKSAAEIRADEIQAEAEEAARLAREAEAKRLADEIAAQEALRERLKNEALAANPEDVPLLNDQMAEAEADIARARVEQELLERQRLLAEQEAAEAAALKAAQDALRAEQERLAQEQVRLGLLGDAEAIIPDNKEANLGDGAGPFQEIPVVNNQDQQAVVDPVINPDGAAPGDPVNPALPAGDGIIPAIPDDRVNPDVAPIDNGGNIPVPEVFGNQQPLLPLANNGGGGAPVVVAIGGGGAVPLPQLPIFVPPVLRDQVVAVIVAQEVLKIQEVAADKKQDAALKAAEEAVVKINEQAKQVNAAIDVATKAGADVPAKITTIALVQVPKVTAPVVKPTIIERVKTTVSNQLTKAEEKLVNALPKNNDVVIKTKSLIKRFTKLFPKGVKIAFSALSASLTKSSVTQLRKLATLPIKKVTITGYVQKSRNTKNDKSLSKSRADAVAKVLTKAGVKKKAITTIAGGVGGKSKKNRSAVLLLS